VADPRSFSIVCLSTQEWAEDLPTNRQQVMSRAAQRGHAVLFVETGSFIGALVLRLIRGPNRRSLATRLLASEDVGGGVRVRKAANLLPWRTKYRISATVNARLTSLVLGPFVRRLPQPVALWVYDPASAWLVGGLRESLAVYDCVDDYVEQAGDNPSRRALAAEADEHATRHADVVFTTTRGLQAEKELLNDHVYLARNAADAALFRSAADGTIAAPELSSLARPVLGFVGSLTKGKVDFPLLTELATRNPSWSFVLVGPERADAGAELAGLRALENVTWVGPKAQSDLPRYVAAFDVALIPYRTTAYTKNCFPLKLYEYLAAGKPVVASGLPELLGMEPDVVVADNADAFEAAVHAGLKASTGRDVARRAAAADQNTWDLKTARLLEIVGAAF
jgi:glycosyltransferase involved in cell wall biosynthesis